MENTKKISNLSIILLIVYYSINSSTIAYTSLIMKDFKQSAWIIPLITLIPTLIMIFLYKSSNFKGDLKKNILFKILMLINGLINTSMLINITSEMMGYAFFKISSTFLFIILIAIVCSILSLGNINKILRLGTLLIFGMLFFIPFFVDIEFSNQPIIDLLPKSIDYKILKGLYFTTITNEIFLYTTINDDLVKPLSRKELIIASFIILITITLQIIDSYTIVNYRYYQDIKILAFNRYFSHQGRRFFEHLDILLLYLLLTTTFYKSSFYTIYIKSCFENFNKEYFLSFYYLIVVFIATLCTKNDLFISILIWGSIILSFIISFIIIFYSRRKKHV